MTKPEQNFAIVDGCSDSENGDGIGRKAPALSFFRSTPGLAKDLYWQNFALGGIVLGLR